MNSELEARLAEIRWDRLLLDIQIRISDEECLRQFPKWVRFIEWASSRRA